VLKYAEVDQTIMVIQLFTPEKEQNIYLVDLGQFNFADCNFYLVMYGKLY
jgi:hypothetical protein